MRGLPRSNMHSSIVLPTICTFEEKPPPIHSISGDMRIPCMAHPVILFDATTPSMPLIRIPRERT